MTARQYDTNGFFEIKRNPLSKVGVYDYSGAQIGAPPADRNKIFKVFRPPEELSAPDAIASFKLIPLVDDHTMIGEGFTDAEKKGIAGVIGEDVFFEDGTLYGNPKIYSKSLAQKIKNGKTELSCGYRCRYEFTPGVWNGQAYDAIQRTLRGNHVALVDEGRMGPEVSILDHMVITVDAKETISMDEELKAVLAAIVARLDKIEGTAAPVAPPVAPAKDGDAPTATPPAVPDPANKPTDTPPPPAKDADTPPAKDDDAPASMDAALQTIAALQGRIAALEGKPSMDEATVVKSLARKTDLVARLGPHIGTFDSAAMTADEVAAYGVEKLGIKGVAKGTEAAALDAYLQAKTTPTPVTTAADTKAASPLKAAIAKHATGV